MTKTNYDLFGYQPFWNNQKGKIIKLEFVDSVIGLVTAIDDESIVLKKPDGSTVIIPRKDITYSSHGPSIKQEFNEIKKFNDETKEINL